LADSRQTRQNLLVAPILSRFWRIRIAINALDASSFCSYKQPMAKTSDIRMRAAEAEKLTLKTGARLDGLPVSTWLRMLGLLTQTLRGKAREVL
jgi:hypothetical protein